MGMCHPPVPSVPADPRSSVTVIRRLRWAPSPRREPGKGAQGTAEPPPEQSLVVAPGDGQPSSLSMTPSPSPTPMREDRESPPASPSPPAQPGGRKTVLLPLSVWQEAAGRLTPTSPSTPPLGVACRTKSPKLAVADKARGEGVVFLAMGVQCLGEEDGKAQNKPCPAPGVPPPTNSSIISSKDGDKGR